MALDAIIFRADAALADVEPLRVQALQRVFDEAGFAWPCDDASYAAAARQGPCREQVAHYVRLALKGRPETADLSLLIDAMFRRSAKHFTERLESGAVTPRPGVREILTAVRREGIRTAVVSDLTESDTKRLLRATLGGWAVDEMTIVCRCDVAKFETANVNSRAETGRRLYHALPAKLALDPADCIVFEGTESGAKAAAAIGFPVIVTPSTLAFDSEVMPRTVNSSSPVGLYYDDLVELIRHYDGVWSESLSDSDRAELVALLQRLHANGFSTDALREGTETMRVADVLKLKGTHVKTIEPAATIRVLADRLKSERVGAMVVVNETGSVLGIISERDIARGVVDYAADLPALKVSTLMTRDVITCQPEDSVAAVAKIMTQRRIRHLPVVVNGRLIGLVSIGDVLKHRLDEVQLEANVLRDAVLARK